MIPQFNVSEARSALACPRMFYFDEERFRRGVGKRRVKSKRITRIWSGPSNVETGCGKLFHDTIERFNSLAASAPEIPAALVGAAGLADAEARLRSVFDDLKRFIVRSCLNRAVLASKTAPQQAAFVQTIDRYVRELATVLSYDVAHGRPVADLVKEFFGDNRKNVDITFRVGPQGEPVRIRGALDYIYFDRDSGAERIIDFKLTPATSPGKDLLQVSLYALMHHQQHRTNPNVAVFYLYPDRTMVTHGWQDIYQQRHVVFDLVASMAAWAKYDEKNGTGLKPPGEPAQCHGCPWNKGNQCQQRLGPKNEGERLHLWSEAAGKQAGVEPELSSQDPPEPAPAVEYDEIEVADAAAADDAPAVADVTAVGQPEIPAPALVPAKRRKKVTTAGPCVDSQGLVIGQANGHFVTLPLAHANTHIAVVGAAGSGKTWMAKVIVEEVIRNGVPVLAIDPQGDLVQFLRRRSEDIVEPALRALHREFVDKVEPRVYTPGSSHGIRLSLNPLRIPTPQDLTHIEREDRRQEEYRGCVSVAAETLVELAGIGGESASQKTLLFKVLGALAAAEPAGLDLNRVVAAVMDPEAVGIASPDAIIRKSEREKLARALNNFIDGPSAGLFTQGVRLDLDRMTKPSQPGKVPLNIIYLNAMSGDEAKQFFVAMLASEVYRWMITSLHATSTTNLLFYIDEARDFIPAGGSQPAAKQPLMRLFTQGRKFGIGCLLCTQSPRSVDYNVFGNCSTKFIGRLESAQDVDRVKEWFANSGAAPAWLAGRKGAEKGTFVARWPGMPADLEGATLLSRMLFSVHEGAWSPDRVEREAGDRQPA